MFVQDLVHDDGRTKVTFARRMELAVPLRIDGKVILERGSDAVWFTFPGAWHDIGRFYRAEGTLTGIYANILVPCTFDPGGDWHTTDLFLDLWLPADIHPWESGRPRDPMLLDTDELEAAEGAGWVSSRLAARARDEVERLASEARAGRWPPRIVEEWTRERIVKGLGSGPRVSP